MRWKLWTSKDEIPDPDTWGGNRNKSKGSGKGKGKEFLVLHLASFYFGKRWIMKDSNIIVDFFKIQKLVSNTSPRQKVDHGLFTTIFDSFSVGRWRIQHQHFLLHWFVQWKKWFGEPSFFASPSRGNIQAAKNGKAKTFSFGCCDAPICSQNPKSYDRWMGPNKGPIRRKPWFRDLTRKRNLHRFCQRIFFFVGIGFGRSLSKDAPAAPGDRTQSANVCESNNRKIRGSKSVVDCWGMVSILLAVLASGQGYS